MSWNKNLPSGSIGLDLGDDEIRKNQDHLEQALAEEHDFPGASGAGPRRHKFPRVNAAGRAALTGMVAGTLVARTDVKQLDVYNGAGWDEYGFSPPGIIVMWSGAIGAIPTGWALCDGTGGTPDLRGRFIVSYDDRGGAAPAHSDTLYTTIGHEGGEKEHELTGAEAPTIDAAGGLHTHTVPYTADAPVVTTPGGNASATQNHTHSIPSSGAHSHTYDADGAGHENRPPYFVLAFIMKS